VSSVAYLIQHLFELVVSPLCSRIRNIVAEHSERSPPPLPLPLLNKTKRGRVQVKFGPDSRHRGPVRNYPAVPVLGDLGRYLSSIYHTFSTTLRLLQLDNHTVDVPLQHQLLHPSIRSRQLQGTDLVGKASVRHSKFVDCVAGSRPIGGLPSRNLTAAAWGFIASSTRKPESLPPLLHSTQRRAIRGYAPSLLLSASQSSRTEPRRRRQRPLPRDLPFPFQLFNGQIY
jgi:hypothetical protein